MLEYEYTLLRDGTFYRAKPVFKSPTLTITKLMRNAPDENNESVTHIGYLIDDEAEKVEYQVCLNTYPKITKLISSIVFPFNHSKYRLRLYEKFLIEHVKMLAEIGENNVR